MTIEQAFKDYEKISQNLYRKVQEYAKCFKTLEQQSIKENYLKDKVTEEEKREIEEKIANLEIDIQNTFVALLNQTNVLIRLLQVGSVFDFNIINKLNKEHIEAIFYYDNTIKQFELLKNHYSDYDFDKVIDFSKMENQKIKLNIEIRKFNQKFLAGLDFQLLSIYDCEKEIFQIRKNTKI